MNTYEELTKEQVADDGKENADHGSPVRRTIPLRRNAAGKLIPEPGYRQDDYEPTIRMGKIMGAILHEYRHWETTRSMVGSLVLTSRGWAFKR